MQVEEAKEVAMKEVEAERAHLADVWKASIHPSIYSVIFSLSLSQGPSPTDP